MSPIVPRMLGKICITTTFDYNYRLGGQTLFKSIRRHTDCTGIDFKVITADPRVIKDLGAENCHVVTEEIQARYSNVKYSKDLPPEKYKASWYRYEMFNFEGYDRVICIDSDCICIEDISYLFSEELNQYDLVSVEDHIVSKCFTKYVPQLESQGLNFRSLKQRMKEGKIDVQPALLVANKCIVNDIWYNKLLAYANATNFTYSIDEGILNDFIYLNGLRIKLLPLEWDYQDLYEIHCPGLPVPSRPVIVHCQESKPFKKKKSSLDPRMHKWHDKWWNEASFGEAKTVVAIIVWNRFENLQLWIRCWKQCDHAGAELVVVHNLESDNARYGQLCRENNIKYVPRENNGFDIGAFQDVCMERLAGFPNSWENLIWITDDCIPMQKDFVPQYLAKLRGKFIPCYEISNEVKRHVRTTGFLVTKDISKRLVFPHDPMRTREDCYVFEHKGFNLYEQMKQMGLEPCMVTPDLKGSPLWDSGCRAGLKLTSQHERVFPTVRVPAPGPTPRVSAGPLDDLAIKHKADKCSSFHGFSLAYDRLLSPYRERFTSMLEIGVAQGQSLKMWCDYFPNAIIHGADISLASKVCESYSPRIKFHLVDQGDAASLKNLEPLGPFDLVVDDGNHYWHEQILTFNTLFPFLKRGGLYIVEDTATSYDGKPYANWPISCVEFFKRLIDDGNLHGRPGRVPQSPSPDFDYSRGWQRRLDLHDNVPEFEEICFLNSIIVVRKRGA